MKTVRTHLLVASALALTVVATPFAQAGGQGGRPGMPARGGNMPQAAASTGIAQDFAIDFQSQEDLIVKAADAMPAEHFDFKPTPPQQSFGERVMHIVQVNAGLFRALGPKTPPPMINMMAKSKADVMMALKQSFDYGLTVVKEFNDQQMVERVMAPRFMGPTASRARIVVVLAGAHGGHLRPDGRVPQAERRHAAGERGSLTSLHSSALAFSSRLRRIEGRYAAFTKWSRKTVIAPTSDPFTRPPRSRGAHAESLEALRDARDQRRRRKGEQNV